MYESVSITQIARPKGLVGGPFGSSLVGSDYETVGVPVIRGTNLGHGKFVGGDFVYVSPQKVERDLSRNTAVGGDLLFTQRGTLGQVALLQVDDPQQYVVSQSQMRLRVDPDLADTNYVYYACSTSTFLKQISDNAISTGVPHINLGILGRLTIPLPTVPAQKAIAEVLGALDDKIAANTKLAETASKLATTLFELAASSSTTIRPLSEVVSTQYGLTTSAHTDPGPKFLRVTDINKQPWITWNTTPNCSVSESDLSKYRVQQGDILVARMADPGKAAYIDAGDPEAVFASYLVRLKAADPSQSLYIYYFLRSDTYRTYAEGAMQGSVQMNMNAKVIVGTDIGLPDASTILAFKERVQPLRQLIQATLQENLSLVATRDTLLPQLMSGTLRVRDDESSLERVV